MKHFSPGSIARPLLALFAALILATGCSRHTDTSLSPVATDVSPRPAVEVATFVGSAACASCHATNYQSQSRSRHAHTMYAMSRQRLGKLAPPVGAVPGTKLVLAEKPGAYVITNSRETGTVDYALGSGKTGMTYVSVLGGTGLAVLRMSYFPREKKWYVTPGQEKLTANHLGTVHSMKDGRTCISCHVVTLPPTGLKPEKRFLGVGCESCHGPGSRHIKAMRKDKYDQLYIAQPSTWPATRINKLCDTCHGPQQGMQAGPMSATLTNRFQTFGLVKSECFQKSKDTLSCITCHNPHTDASTDVKTYEAVCLQCHASAKSPHGATGAIQHTDAMQQKMEATKQCPVNPKENCVSCHMPAQKAVANSAIPTKMADHYIRVHLQ